MTEDSNSVSRRNVLAGLGAIGVGGALAGAGTSAYFSDEETFEGNELVAGELDLKIDWQQMYYGPTEEWEFVNAHPDHDGDGEQSFDDGNDVYKYSDNNRNLGDDELDYCSDVDDNYHFGENQSSLIHLDDIKPGDRGEVTFSYHLCDNPGWVWFGAPDVDASSDLAEAIEATLWYDLDGNNDLDGNEPTIAEGSLRHVLGELEGGILLDGAPAAEGENGGTGNGGANVETSDHDTDLVWSEQDQGKLGGDEHGDLDCDSDEVDYWKWILTPGGQDSISSDPLPKLTVEFADGKTVTTTGYFPGGQGSGAVHFDVYYGDSSQVEDATAYYSGGGENTRLTISNGECLPKGPSNGDGPVRCVQNSTTQFIALEWHLPMDPNDIDDVNDVQGEEVTFDLEFYTEQCRHNPDPQNPWTNGA